MLFRFSIKSIVQIWTISLLAEVLCTSTRRGCWNGAWKPVWNQLEFLQKYPLVSSKNRQKNSRFQYHCQIPSDYRRPAISVNHFLVLRFLIFKLSESFWNCFILILLDQEMNFKKILIKKYLFFVEKNNFFEKSWNIFWKLFRKNIF